MADKPSGAAMERFVWKPDDVVVLPQPADAASHPEPEDVSPAKSLLKQLTDLAQWPQ